MPTARSLKTIKWRECDHWAYRNDCRMIIQIPQNLFASETRRTTLNNKVDLRLLALSYSEKCCRISKTDLMAAWRSG
jgi:hypothetical protein